MNLQNEQIRNANNCPALMGGLRSDVR